MTACDWIGLSTTATTTEIAQTTTTLTTTTTSDSTQTTTASELTMQLRYIYNLAVEADAFSGTYEEWLLTVTGPAGSDGREIMLQIADGYIQWRYEGDSLWTNLIELNVLVGPSGADGSEVTFKVSEGFIQWQYVGDTTWTNLIELEELVGASGADGLAGEDGKEVTFQVSDGYIQWQYVGDAEWLNLIEVSSLVGNTGNDGADGSEILLKVSEGYIQWQYAGDSTWTNLIDLATLTGADGTNGTDGADGVDGREVMFQVAGGYIQWQYAGDSTWTNLIDLATLTGADGTNGTDGVDGREVIFQVAEGHIQWQYAGDSTWTNLIDLATLTGADGTNGTDGADGVDGREVMFQVAGGYIQWQYAGDSTWTNLIDLATLTGADGTNGADGTDGVDGREVIFQVAGGYIQWQYAGDSTWTNLIDLATLTGADGTNGTDGADGVDGREVMFQVAGGYIQWQYAGDSTWTNLIDLATLTGADGTNGTDGIDGREVIFQVAGGYIQWQYAGDSTWTNLIDLATLTGADGTNGTDGVDGVDGREVIFQVAAGYIQWQYAGDSAWTNLIDLATLTGADGTNGTDGVDGVDGREVIFQVAGGYIQWQYAGDSAWTNLIDLATLTGADGTNGTDGVDGREVIFQVATGYIQWQYTGDATWTNLIEVATLVGDTGESGVGVSSMEINESGELIVTYSDLSTQNLGQVMNVYTVVFKDFNGYVLDVQYIVQGNDALAPSDPTRAGYTFTGWDGLYTNVLNNIFVTALYTVNTFTVDFDSNGGSSVASINDVSYGSTITLSIPTREGYFFDGWYMGDTVNDPQFTSGDFVFGNMTLYARWEEAGYTVTFVDYDNTILLSQNVTHGFSAAPPAEPTRDGYDFTGWDNSYMVITSNLTVKAQYTAIDYTIYFISNGGTAVSDYTAAFETALPVFAEPTRTGNDFMGWYVDAELTTLFSDTTMPLDGLTLYAKWEVSTYYINFNTSGGDPIASIEVEYGSSVDSLPDATKLDNTFAGWQLDGIDFNTPYMYFVEEDITLDAVWIGLEAGIIFELSGDEVTITGYSGSSTDLIIPDTISGYPVTAIGPAAFKGNTTIVNLSFGQYVITVGNEAFMNMTNLETISLPNSAKSFGSFVFYGNSHLQTMTISSEMAYTLRYLFGDNINYVPDSLAIIKYADGATYINTTLLNANLNGVAIELADDCTSIADNQFKNLAYITEVIIPDGVVSIGSYAFYNSNITSLVMPNSVTSIGNYAFAYTTYLQSVTLSNALTDIPVYAFLNSGLLSVEIPVSVTHLHEGAFQDCYDLATITFAEGGMLTMIGESAFKSCHAVENITIPANVEEIGLDAFRYCINLQNLWFETDSILQLIDSYAFYGTNLTSLVLPDNLLTIGSSAYASNNNLMEVFVPNSVTSMGTAFTGARGFVLYTDALTKPAGWTINEESWTCVWGYIETIDDGELVYATTVLNEAIILRMSASNINGDIVIPSSYGSYSVTDIAIAAFEYNLMITSVSIPYTMTEIAPYAFYEATNLGSVTFESISQLSIIREYAFYQCDALTEIEIPANVLVIENQAFYHCENLATITFAPYSQIETIELQAFAYGAFTEVTLPDTIINLEGSAFAPSNRSMLIYTDLQSKPVGWADFQHNQTAIWGYIETIDNGEFVYATSTLNEAMILGLSETNLNSDIIIPENLGGYVVTGFANYVFYQNTQITSIVIPNSVTSLPYYGFGYASNLISVLIDETSPIQSIAGGVFAGCSSLLEFNIPENVQIIEGGAFSGCDSITYMTIPANVEIIDNQAFYDCSNLSYLYIENGSNLTTIGQYVFRNTSLRNIILPISVETISSSNPFAIDDDLTEDYKAPYIYAEASSQPSGWDDSSPSIYSNVIWGITDYGIYGDFYYVVKGDNTIVILGLIPESTMTDVVIPETIGGRTVNEIGACAFYESALTSISIPESITKIGRYAFYGSTSLVTVDIAESSLLNVIDYAAFMTCSNLQNINLENAVNLVEIGVSAFRECTSLTTISIAEGSILETIGSSAFSNCTQLQSINLEEALNLSEIGYNSFDNCVSLQTIILTINVTTIYTDAFKSCSQLTIYAEAESEPEGWNYWNPNNRPVVWGYTGYYQSTISFETNGGTVIDPMTQDEGTVVTAPTDPTRINYTFGGWYSDEALTVPYTFTTMPEDDLTLYAEWIAVEFTLYFYDYDGMTILQESVHQVGSDLSGVSEPENPTRIGYTFSGWDSAIPATMPGNDVTIIAEYSINQYTISFDANGGSAVTAITQDYGTAVTEPTEPTKAGYDFAGWYSDVGLTTPYTFTTMPAENITLYADWSVAQFSITYEDWDGSVLQTADYDYNSDITGVTAPTDPTRTGYTFNAWDNTLPSTMPAENIVITALYDVNQYTISFDSNGGSAVTAITQDYGSVVTQPSDPTMDYYTFAGWYSDAGLTIAYTFDTMPAENITLYADWAINQYSITYEDWDGSVLQTADYDYGADITGVTAPSDPSRTGYTFDSWDASLPSTMPGNDITITATYTVNQYTISFDTNGGSAVTAITQDYGTAVTEPTDPTRAGYDFAGWYSDVELTTAYTFSTMPAENITLYADWTIYLTYTLKGDSTYEVTGYIGSPVDVVIPTTHEGVAVTSIADDAFTSCSSMQTIVIADSITTIGSYVFNGCDNLVSAYIPDSVVTMGGYVFIYIDTATIYCEAASQPAGWDSNWDFWSASTIVWGYTG